MLTGSPHFIAGSGEILDGITEWRSASGFNYGEWVQAIFRQAVIVCLRDSRSRHDASYHVYPRLCVILYTKGKRGPLLAASVAAMAVFHGYGQRVSVSFV
jgi:hypothetical protein